MKKIVPFKKELAFKTNIVEITSISLEHNLHLSDNALITGSFMITGDYKLTDSSTSTENFSFDLPFDITIDDKYKLDNIVIDIDDFYYEIIDNKTLSINIDVLIDKLEEKPLINKEIIEQKDITLEEALKDLEDDGSERCYDVEFPFKENPDKIEAVSIDKEFLKEDENIKSIFNNFDNEAETYSTYRVCIMRENETIDSVLQKYNITKEELSMYNDLDDVKIGDKLIIPSLKNEKV